MCGICGVIAKTKIDRDDILNMTRTLKHRGPDNINIEVFDNLGLGHARLSVIDLSSSASQPMSNEDDSIWLVYNLSLIHI